MDDYVLVTRQIFGETIAYLKESFEVVDNQEDKILSADELCRLMGNALGVQTSTNDRIDGPLLDKCPKLKVVSNTAVGYDNIDVAACTERGVMVTNTPGVLDETVADYAMALVLSATRKIPQGERYLRGKKWTKNSLTFPLSRDVFGSTFGFMGFGRIGQAIAKRALSFNGRIIYHCRNRVSTSLEEKYQATFVTKTELLSSADIVVLILPHTDDTHHLIGRDELTIMKKSATLVNMARGGIVDDSALIEALQEGDIYAAGLDVYENEPHLHPGFLGLDNVVLSPHLGSATIHTRQGMAMRAATNLVAALSDGNPPDLVNPECLKMT